MSKDLYARDVLTFSEYQELHTHLANDEYWLLVDVNTLQHVYNCSVSESPALRISAFEIASSILATEPVKELLEYDLQHVFNYDERFDYIISKLERAVNKD